MLFGKKFCARAPLLSVFGSRAVGVTSVGFALALPGLAALGWCGCRGRSAAFALRAIENKPKLETTSASQQSDHSSHLRKGKRKGTKERIHKVGPLLSARAALICLRRDVTINPMLYVPLLPLGLSVAVLLAVLLEGKIYFISSMEIRWPSLAGIYLAVVCPRGLSSIFHCPAAAVVTTPQ